MTKNAIGKDIPSRLPGFDNLIPFKGEWTRVEELKNSNKTYKAAQPLRAYKKGTNKLLDNLDECLKKLDLKDGMTISFHHHMRGGDETIYPVVTKLAEMGLKDLTIASSSLTSAHECLVPFLKNGVITQIWTSGARGQLGKAISEGVLEKPVIFHSHGGRARAIIEGKLKIDVAFLGASAADKEGNATGSFGASAFGSMGYPIIDSEYARQVVILTDNLVEYPCIPASIKQQNVDYVVKFDSLGNPKKIAGDSTRITRNPMDLRIAYLAAKAIEKLGVIKPDFSLQLGAGGASLAVAKFIREKMVHDNIKGSFMLGGITSVMTQMLEEGLFTTAYDVQSFDAEVKDSIYNNPKHIEISANEYANPFNCGCMTHQLDVVVLAALEIDTNFNVNVMVGSDGYIRGASGGHSDTAAGADLTVVVAPSIRGRLPIVTKQIMSVVTPGSSVDLLVTERGICINPARKDIQEKLQNSGLPICDIHELAAKVAKICGEPTLPEFTDKIVALIEYRDGSIIDVIRQVKK